MDTLDATRRAQDSLVLLALTLSGFGLAVAGPLMAIPVVSLLGVPIGLAAGLAFACGHLIAGRFEVAGWRQAVGLLGVVAGLAVYGHAYFDGLGVITAHFLGRAGAPPLTALTASVVPLGLASLVLGAAARLRRATGWGLPIGVAAISALGAALGWGLTIVAGLLGAPFGA